MAEGQPGDLARRSEWEDRVGGRIRDKLVLGAGRWIVGEEEGPGVHWAPDSQYVKAGWFSDEGLEVMM